MNEPIAIVLGGTNPHKALIDNLQGRGYYTILVDYLDSPPAADVADEHLKESTLDKEKVLQIAKEYKADLVIATCVDQANVTACYVAEKLNLPHPYSYKVAASISNKIEMKKILTNHGISTSPFCLISKNDDVSKLDLPKYPIVVKPSDTGGSKGVQKVSDFKQLNEAVDRAFRVSKSPQLIAESFKPGVNVDAVCFVKEGEAEILMLRKRYGIRSKGGAVLQYFQSLIPADISEKANRNIKGIIQRIADVFELKNTPVQLQVIINGDDVSVIEFAPRIGGGLSFKTVEMIYGINLIDAAIDSYFSLPSKLTLSKPDHFFSENNIYADSCTFGNLLGLDKLVADKVIEVGYCYKNRGDNVGADMTSSDRIGSFIVKADSLEVLKAKIIKAVSIIKVHDISENEVMKRSIFKNGI